MPILFKSKLRRIDKQYLSLIKNDNWKCILWYVALVFIQLLSGKFSQKLRNKIKSKTTSCAYSEKLVTQTIHFISMPHNGPISPRSSQKVNQRRLASYSTEIIICKNVFHNPLISPYFGTVNVSVLSHFIDSCNVVDANFYCFEMKKLYFRNGKTR